MSDSNYTKAINSPEFDQLVTKASTYGFPREEFFLSELKKLFTPAHNVRGEHALITEGKAHLNALIKHVEQFEYDPKMNPITIMRYKGKLYAIDGYHRTIALLAIDKYKDAKVSVQVMEVKSEELFKMATRFMGLALNATNAPSMANSKITLEHLIDKYFDDMEGGVLKQFLFERVGGNESDIRRIYSKIEEARKLAKLGEDTNGSVTYINYTSNEGRAIASKIKNRAAKEGYIVSQGNQADAVFYLGGWVSEKLIPLSQKDKSIKGIFYLVPRVTRCKTPLPDVITKLETLAVVFKKIGLNITIKCFPVHPDNKE